MRDCIKKFGALGQWAVAAEHFADYWGGAGTWGDMSPERRAAFAEALKPNYFEWDAVMDESTPVSQWARLLPRATLVVSDPHTVAPIRAIDALLRRHCPFWTYREIAEGGHMAPLTRPDIINPIVRSFLTAPLGLRPPALRSDSNVSDSERREIPHIPRRQSQMMRLGGRCDHRVFEQGV